MAGSTHASPTVEPGTPAPSVERAYSPRLEAWRRFRRHRLAVASAEVECGLPAAAELQRYLASGQWRGKAGGYGVQDDAQSFFRVVSGRFDTVVGLSVAAVRDLLAHLRAAR